MGQGSLHLAAARSSPRSSTPTGRRCAVDRRAARMTKLYGNPGFGYMYTAGSNAVTRLFQAAAPVAGAQARKVLLERTPPRWNVPVERAYDRAERGRAQGLEPAHLSYGEIAAFAEVPAEAAEDRRQANSRSPAVPPHRQSMIRASSCRRRSTAARNTASTSRCRACSTPPCCNRPIEGGAPERSTTPRPGGARRHRRSCGCPTASA